MAADIFDIDGRTDGNLLNTLSLVNIYLSEIHLHLLTRFLYKLVENRICDYYSMYLKMLALVTGVNVFC